MRPPKAVDSDHAVLAHVHAPRIVWHARIPCVQCAISRGEDICKPLRDVSCDIRHAGHIVHVPESYRMLSRIELQQ